MGCDELPGFLFVESMTAPEAGPLLARRARAMLRLHDLRDTFASHLLSRGSSSATSPRSLAMRTSRSLLSIAPAGQGPTPTGRRSRA